MKNSRTAAKWLAGLAVVGALFISTSAPAQAKNDDTGWDLRSPTTQRIVDDTGWD
jgi:hypothetical protein